MTVGTADEVKQLFLELQSAGLAFHQPLERQPWGALNFVVKDFGRKLAVVRRGPGIRMTLGS